MLPFKLGIRRGRALLPYLEAVVAPFAPHLWIKEAWRNGYDSNQVAFVLDAPEARALRDWISAALPHMSKSKTKVRSKRNRAGAFKESKAAEMRRLAGHQ